MDDLRGTAPKAVRLGEQGRPKGPPKWPIYVVLGTAVMVPALFWHRVWFGTPLSDEEIRWRLNHPTTPRHVQHACEQISRRIARDPERSRQFYDLLVPLADHPDEEMRCVVAWCMGEDNTRHPPFHQALLRMANDKAPRVRYNAALGLVRFGDPAARDVLREMLLPRAVAAHWEGPSSEGVVADVLRKGDLVKPRMQLALVDAGAGDLKPVPAPLGGRLGEVRVVRGASIRQGEHICAVEPTFQQIYEALRALALMGEADDLPYVEQYFDANDRFSGGQRARIQAQAQLAAEEIRRRDVPQKR